ncbi:hypothetical protein DICA3_D10946 [Diutina catenulata]
MSVIIIVIIAVFLYLIKDIIIELVGGGSGAPKEEEVTVLDGKFTPVTLAKYNGADHPKIFIGVKGRVFDVTMGKAFYGPGGPYANFGGRDASRGLALNSFEPECLTPVDQPIDLLEDLTDSQKESLDSWEEHFENKYKVVGSLANP